MASHDGTLEEWTPALWQLYLHRQKPIVVLISVLVWSLAARQAKHVLMKTYSQFKTLSPPVQLMLSLKFTAIFHALMWAVFLFASFCYVGTQLVSKYSTGQLPCAEYMFPFSLGYYAYDFSLTGAYNWKTSKALYLHNIVLMSTLVYSNATQNIQPFVFMMFLELPTEIVMNMQDIMREVKAYESRLYADLLMYSMGSFFLFRFLGPGWGVMRVFLQNKNVLKQFTGDLMDQLAALPSSLSSISDMVTALKGLWPSTAAELPVIMMCIGILLLGTNVFLLTRMLLKHDMPAVNMEDLQRLRSTVEKSKAEQAAAELKATSGNPNPKKKGTGSKKKAGKIPTNELKKRD